MTGDSLYVLAWLMAACSGLMAGFFLAFSAVIMKSLATLSPSQGIDAMNAINKVILKTVFMPLFFGSSLLALVMMATSLWFLSEPGAGKTLTAGLIYFFGMFLTTAAVNVPLNNKLASVSGGGEEAQHIWQKYLTRWTRWNTSRSVWSFATLVICLDLIAR